MNAWKCCFLFLLLWLSAAALAVSCGGDDDDDDNDDAIDDDDDNGGDDDDDVDDDDVGDDDDDDDDDDDTTVDGELAFIYEEDDTSGKAFKLHLEDAGYTVTLYKIDELDAKIDFSGTDAFLIDVIEGTSDWNSGRRGVLDAADKPIIALGDGAYVFEGTGRYIDPGKCTWRANGISVTPVNATHSIWTAPHDLAPTGDPIAVFTTTDWVYALEDNGAAPGGVEFLGENPEQADEYLIAVEDGKYALWGFGAKAPTIYTQDGKHLLINLIEYVRSSK